MRFWAMGDMFFRQSRIPSGAFRHYQPVLWQKCDSKYCIIWRTWDEIWWNHRLPLANCSGGGTGFDETTCLGSAHGAWRLWLLHLRTCVRMPSNSRAKTHGTNEILGDQLDFCGIVVLLCFIMFYYVLLTWLVLLVWIELNRGNFCIATGSFTLCPCAAWNGFHHRNLSALPELLDPQSPTVGLV